MKRPFQKSFCKSGIIIIFFLFWIIWFHIMYTNDYYGASRIISDTQSNINGNANNKCNIFSSNQNRVFITYGGGKKGYERARKRLMRQAIQTGIFTESVGYYMDMIKNDKEFKDMYRKLVKKYKQGNGYWIWKPYIIMKELNKTRNGDLIVYADAGCKFNMKHKEKWLNTLKDMKCKYNKDIILQGMKTTVSKWCRIDSINYYGLYNETNNSIDNGLINFGMHVGGILWMYNTPKVREFINKWYWDMYYNYETLLIDSKFKTILPNMPDFQVHRHDQCILTIIGYKYFKDIIYDISDTTWPRNIGFIGAYRSRNN